MSPIVRDQRGRILGGHWREPKPFYDPEWCRREYVERGRSAGDIAAEFGVSENAVLFWLDKLDIPRRSTAEVRAQKHWGVTGAANPMHGKVGALNPNYKDGSSPDRQRLYASAEWRKVARQVRARDGRRCVRCGAEKQGPRSLHIHHIVPWAGNPELRFDLDNLETLCRPCHVAAHTKGGGANQLGG